MADAGTDGNVQRTTASHERTTIFNVVSYENGLIRMVNNATGVETCTNWQVGYAYLAFNPSLVTDWLMTLKGICLMSALV